jgi:Trehalase
MTSRLEPVPGLAGAERDALLAGAQKILDQNWTGRSTVASRTLYPHQWSWDAAFIAIGRAWHQQELARLELESLLAGQWANGMIPHIVFDPAVPRGSYFPGPEFWDAARANGHRGPGPGPATSGILQPPLHARAALEIHRRAGAGDQEASLAFLARVYPKLVAWHDHLAQHRDVAGHGLAALIHPWESGMDNSPLWDDALARIALPPAAIPDYQRVDADFVDAAQRPSDEHYDRYAYLVKLYREWGYDAERTRAECPFVVRDVLFNSILVQANRDLAEIARVLGDDPEPFDSWAARTAAGMDDELWDEAGKTYLDYDVRAATHIRVRTGAGFAPLYAGVPDAERAEVLVRRLEACEVAVDGVGRVVASVPPGDPGFEPARYWRGPVWPMLNWVAHAGLRRYGFAEDAAEIRQALLALARREGFWEHYNALTGDGGGTEELSWTAALVLDLLDAEHDDEGGGA